ncbi:MULTISPECIES: retron system putative HNH endonuclease [Psychrobacter]|uniref:retron system putative HNH endonuclease n=1 Tax=Psychrobacter TaxID=497 RepID=UPI0019198C3A|nr:MULTISPECIES: retron system putative HNH endonuclease [Psychrobacter]
MQKIDKLGKMPEESVKGFKSYKSEQWGQIPEELKTKLREQLSQEQNGLCCYCCQIIDDKTTHIEHLQCRQDYPKKCFDYENLLLSCSTRKQCDNAKGSQALPLTPLMTECDSEIKLNLAGELVSDTERGKQAIEILNLNNRESERRRKGLIDNIKFTFDPNQSHSPPINIQDFETLKLIMDSMPNLYQRHELEYIIKKLIG